MMGKNEHEEMAGIYPGGLIGCRERWLNKGRVTVFCTGLSSSTHTDRLASSAHVHGTPYLPSCLG
jgi:hypothetical protein